MVHRAVNGDPEAFRYLLEEYKNLVYAICLNVVRDPFEAENLTQETFLQVYKSLSRYENRGFKSWLSRIALNKAIDYKRKTIDKAARESIGLAEMENIADDKMLIQDWLIQEEEKALLEECLRRIPEHYEIVLRKSYQENKSCKQIAEEEKLSVRTVETRLYRGKKILRECFEELNKP